jgi:hypothetical protein
MACAWPPWRFLVEHVRLWTLCTPYDFACAPHYRIQRLGVNLTLTHLPEAPCGSLVTKCELDCQRLVKALSRVISILGPTRTEDAFLLT